MICSTDKAWSSPPRSNRRGRSETHKAFKCRQEGEANLRAATEVNAVSASLTLPVSRPTQLELFPGRARVTNAKLATIQSPARVEPKSPGRCISTGRIVSIGLSTEEKVEPEAARSARLSPDPPAPADRFLGPLWGALRVLTWIG